MKYNPQFHHRHSIRHPVHDYRKPGLYFVTICTYQKEYLLGEIADGKMVLNDNGHIVRDCWESIPDHFGFVELDEYTIMPNHMHGIIRITNHQYVDHSRDMACHVPTILTNKRTFSKPGKNSLSRIIGSFKSSVTRLINLSRQSPGNRVWQPRFFDRVIRNQYELQRIRKYIQENPSNWDFDEEKM